MKGIISLIAVVVLLESCRKQNEPPPVPTAEARYRVVATLAWSRPQFSLPATNAHFTAFIGAVHHIDTFLWKPGGLATQGVEFVAEVGSGGRLNAEIDGIIAKGKALKRFAIPAPAVNGVFDTIFNFTLQHAAISFVSMIAPSPDWFVGLSSYSLIQNNQWVDDITVPLYLFDAGTEEGDIFGYDNPTTNPQQPIKPLSASMATVLANGNASLPAIGSIRFIKL